ncbi:MAG TPA: chalcone isomerase family protein [Myxococcaceae bacterium]|nr:chalcone isomerase family protein [Myxococcaceae bacterium]
MAGSLRIAVLLLSSLVSFPVVAKDVEGTQVPDTVSQDGKTLRLIGGGVRTKWMFSVYVGALYAEKPTFNAPNLIKSEQMKRMDLHLLRDVGKDKIIESIREGFEKQSKDQMPALKDRLDQLAAAVPDLKKGDLLSLTYVPEKGVVVGGAAKEAVIPGKDFADALFSVWLGPDPVDAELKRKLLGG